jgi:hypothetical protein
MAERFFGSNLAVRLDPEVDGGRRRPAVWSTAAHRALEDNTLAVLEVLVGPAADPGYQPPEGSMGGCSLTPERRQWHLGPGRRLLRGKVRNREGGRASQRRRLGLQPVADAGPADEVGYDTTPQDPVTTTRREGRAGPRRITSGREPEPDERRQRGLDRTATTALHPLSLPRSRLTQQKP